MSFLVKITIFAAIAATICTASPAKPAFWKGTNLDASVEEMRSMCAEDDPIACLKYKALAFLDTIVQKDNYQISDNVEVSRNDFRAQEEVGRTFSAERNLEDYVKTHDVTFKLPVLGSVTLGARNLDNEQLDFKLNFNDQPEARKSKLKKIFIPILVFVLLKAMTLVPLALGILGLKAWNALQLSFFSFVVSVGLAIFQLCKKIAADGAHPHVTAHAPWEATAYPHYAARALDAAQEMAYGGQVTL